MLKRFKNIFTNSTTLSGTPITKSKSILLRRRRFYKPFDFPLFVKTAFDHEKIHWTEEETGVEHDVHDWRTGKLTDAEKYQITETLKVFTQQDMTVAGFYEEVLIPTFKNNDAQTVLTSFAAREQIHIRAYALLNDTLGLPESDYSAFVEEKALADKIDFAMQADASTIEGMGLSLVKSIINEGLSLFGSFVPLLNYQRRGLMKGMGTVVEWSIRDETMHANTITIMFRQWISDHPWILTDAFKKKVYDMFRQAIELEDAFIDKIYSLGPVEGLSKDVLKLYMRFLADFRLFNIGFKANWGIKENPVDWLDWMLIGPDHTNFFEKKSTEYERKTAVGQINYDSFSRKKFVVYGWAGCRFCEATKERLALENIPFEFHELATQIERDKFFANQHLTGSERTAPQIFVDDKRVGGYDNLCKLLQ